MVKQNRQFGRASRPAESGALIAGRTYKKRVGAGRARQAALGFAKVPAPAPSAVDAGPAAIQTEQEASQTTLVSDALLDALAVAIAEPLAADRPELEQLTPEAPELIAIPASEVDDVTLPEAPELVAIPASEAGDVTLPEALEVRPPVLEERVEAARPAARPARKRSVVLPIAVAASIAGAGVIGYAHFPGKLRLPTPALPAITAALPALAVAEAPPAPARAATPALVSTEVTTLAPSTPAVSGTDRNGIVEVAALPPTENVTAHPVVMAEKADAPPAPAARVAAPKKPEKPVARQVAAAKPAAEASRSEPKPAPRPERSRGVLQDLWSDVTDLLP